MNIRQALQEALAKAAPLTVCSSSFRDDYRESPHLAVAICYAVAKAVGVEVPK